MCIKQSKEMDNYASNLVQPSAELIVIQVDLYLHKNV